MTTREAAGALFDDLGSLLDLDVLVLAAIDRRQRVARPAACRGVDDEERLLRTAIDLRDPSAIATAVNEGRAIAVAETAGSDDVLVGLTGATSLALVPLLDDGDVSGVVIGGTKKRSRRDFSQADLELMQALSSEKRLVLGLTRSTEALAAALEQQAALLEAAHVLSSDLEFESVIRRLVGEVVTVLRADAADCWIFDRDRKFLVNRAVWGLPESELGRRIRAERVHRRALEGGRPVLARRLAASERPLPGESYGAFEDVMVAPITWLGETRGVLGVCALESYRFESADLEVLEAFARLASLALNNAESFELRDRQAQLQRGFSRIADVLGSPLSHSQTLAALAQAACEVLGGAAAFVLQAAGTELLVAAAYELRPPVEEAVRACLHDPPPIFEVAVRDGRIVVSGRVNEDERVDGALREAIAQGGHRALLCAPVGGSWEREYAVVVLFERERFFSDDDLVLARQLGSAASGALDRSKLFESERRARTFSQRLADHVVRLVSGLDPTVLLEETVSEAPRLLNCAAAAVRLLEGGELVVHATSGGVAERLDGVRASSGAGLAGEVAQSRAPLVVSDVREAPRLGRGDPLLARAASASMAVPLLALGGGLHGVLSVYELEPRLWREDELQALVALGAATSAALAHAELYQRVAEEKERNDAILANIADGIVAVDRDEQVVRWNEMAEEITGVRASEACGRRIDEALGGELRSDGDGGTRERQVAIRRGGAEVWLSLTEAVMRDANGTVAGRIFAFRDISAERMVEQMKTDFVGTVSHELRTPLTSIYGFAETLLRRDVDFGEEERGTFLAYIVSECARLIGSVDALLNVARLEAGTLGLTVTDTDVAEVVEEVVAPFEERGAAHRFVVELRSRPLVARADRQKLTQVVQNLVDNAVKFSPEGGVVTISGRPGTDMVELRVSDEGMGIPQSDRDRVFSKFFRAGTAPASGAPGTGLGLFLARGLVAAMGGRIWFTSEEGSGSTFAFELPASRSATRGEKALETATRP